MKTITEDGEIIDENTYETVAMAPPFFKTPWNHDTDREAANVALECKDPSRTQQQFAKDADINVILAKFLNTGELNTTGAPVYQNAEEEFDLQTSMVTSYQVEEAWNELPTAVRAVLGTPKKFLEYVDHCVSTGDLEPLRELGLTKQEAPKPTFTGTPAPGTAEEPVTALKPPTEVKKDVKAS